MKMIKILCCRSLGICLAAAMVLTASAAGTSVGGTAGSTSSTSGTSTGRTTGSKYVVTPAKATEEAKDLIDGLLWSEVQLIKGEDGSQWYLVQIHTGAAIYDIRVDAMSGKVIDYTRQVIYQYGEDDKAIIAEIEKMEANKAKDDKEFEAIINDKKLLSKYSYLWEDDTVEKPGRTSRSAQ